MRAPAVRTPLSPDLWIASAVRPAAGTGAGEVDQATPAEAEHNRALPVRKRNELACVEREEAGFGHNLPGTVR